jgi:hypothetical protein
VAAKIGRKSMTSPFAGLHVGLAWCLGFGARLRVVLRHGFMRVHRASMILMLAAGALAGCSGFGKPQQAATPDPNILPANYRTTLLAFLRQSLTNKDDFRGAMISEPAIKPVEGSAHYVVCVQFNPKSAIKTKAAIFLSGQMTQFVDAAPEQCADAAYQPFKELDAANPTAGQTGHFQLLGVPL